MKHKICFFLLMIYSVVLCQNETETKLYHSHVDNMTLCVKSHLVKIGQKEQDILLSVEYKKCLNLASKSDVQRDDPNRCPVWWDSITCWPETLVNHTAQRDCANYINKFNKKHKAFIHCVYDPISKTANWTKTNYTFCLSYEKSDFCNHTSCSIENQIDYMLASRIVGNVASFISLILSIIILFRPKLRCPRNYVHINLFVAFIFRTLMIIFSELATRSDPNSKRKLFLTDSVFDNNENMFFCRSIVSLFRYSGSTYHMAILSEAIYLVLLLKFPYYNELKGSTFCILITWTLPFLWLTPWVITRISIDNYWCWQSESYYNLILKIPQTMIYFVNGVCAAYIIRILYSKMRNKTMSREKIMKYRRLAKSILIIIPIFGLHFIFFAWIPYLPIFNIEIGPCFEVVLTSIENLFNSFQGLVVSIVCCFIHREFRVELILFTYQSLNKIKFISSLSCMDSDYIRQLRYTQSRGASIPCADTNSSSLSFDKYKSKQDEKNPMLTPVSSKKVKKTESAEEVFTENRKSITGSPSIMSMKNESTCCCCCCLFGDQKNDFFADSRRKSNTKKSSNGFFSKEKKSRKKSGSLSRPPSSLTQVEDSQVNIRNLGSIQENTLKSIIKTKNSDTKLNDENSNDDSKSNKNVVNKKSLSFTKCDMDRKDIFLEDKKS